MSPLEALKHHFGYEQFRPAQEEIINSIILGKSTITVLPTGGGKSICYQVPALIAEKFSIVISPLIALMKDQVDSINKKGRIAAFINSSLNYGETEEVFRAIENGSVKLLYLAPERLENISFAERIKNLSPFFLFVDEAHCISEWGHNFRPSYRKIKEFAEFINIERISAFTATATPEVIKDIAVQLGLKNPLFFVKGFERANLSINVIKTKKKNEECLNLISRFKTPAIIYASSRKRTEEITGYLNLYNMNAAFYHAGMAPEERRHVQDLFINDKIKIIVATTAFGMGIDKSDIRLIIHYNMPGTIEGYYQEIGRAGRDGLESHAFLLYDDSDKYIHKYFISNSYPDKELIVSIYNAVCDLGTVALGSTSDKDISITPEYASAYTKQSVSNAKLVAALNILEQAGYIKNISELEKRTYVRFNVSLENLKKYVKKISDNEIKDLILFLLNEYGSRILNSRVPINTGNITISSGLSEEYLNDLLFQLHNNGILEYSRPTSGKSIKIIVPRVTDNYLYIDYKKIADAYNNSLSKLNTTIDYVYSSECRMKYVISYFGESEDEYKCGKCDNCTGQIHLTSGIYNYVSEIILRTLKESGSGLGEKEIVNILSGNTEKVYSTSGSCSNYSQNDIITIVNELISKEIVSRNKSGKLIIINNKEYFEFDKPKSSLGNEDLFDYEDNIEIYNKLREARRKAAVRFQQSPYLICTDEMLRKISELKPDTPESLLAVKGFNQRMFNKAGYDFLEVIQEHLKSKGKVEKAKNKKALPASISETYNLLLKGYSLKDISSLRKLSPAVISMQIETILEYEPGTEIISLFNSDKVDLIQKEIDTGFIDLKELKDHLPGEIDYPEIRIVLAKHKYSSSKKS